jgi:hypothetical protein
MAKIPIDAFRDYNFLLQCPYQTLSLPGESRTEWEKFVYEGIASLLYHYPFDELSYCTMITTPEKA